MEHGLHGWQDGTAPLRHIIGHCGRCWLTYGARTVHGLQNFTVMHLGGDTSAAEAPARAHSARRMTRTYGQLDAGGMWL